MLTCNSVILRDDPINLNSPDTAQQLQLLLGTIVDFLTTAMNYNTPVQDISTMTVQSAL